MDFTPVNFSGIPNINRKTTGGFEAASAVLFTSGIQHIAETANGMAAQQEFIKEYMRTLPETWDDVKFIDGFPGKYVVLARRREDTWYIAGINGENLERTITLKLPFIKKTSKGIMISDADNTKDLVQREVDFSGPLRITLPPYGGFVIKN
jgi:hypothetical protein